MRLTIHRGAKEIGGTCIELQSKNSRILLDFGLPLVDGDGNSYDGWKLTKKSKEELIEQGILPDIEGALVGQDSTIDAILLSHPHQDHYGLMPYICPSVPTYMSQGCKALIEVSAFFGQTNFSPDNTKTIEPWKPSRVGDFTITPYLADHSGFDAFSYLIECENKRIFYSGDFRAHGRKSIVFDKLIKNPPNNIDYLLLEGSMIDRDKGEFETEKDIEEALVNQFRDSDAMFFMACSSQNIDRIVSVYRACKRSGRTFVIDPYTAYILDELREISPNIPQFDWGKNIGVHYTGGSHSKKLFETNIAYKYKSAKITFDEIVSKKDKFIVKDSFAVRDKFANNNELDNTTLIFSLWEGYLEEYEPFWKKHNVPIIKIHCSGHANGKDLQKLAQALNPKNIIPFHTFHPNKYSEMFDNVLILQDKQTITL